MQDQNTSPMRVPRTLSKEVFRYVFSSDGTTPASYETLYEHYVAPHLEDIDITEAVWKKYKGLPYTINRKLIQIHQITEEEISFALQACAAARARRRKLSRKSASS